MSDSHGQDRIVGAVMRLFDSLGVEYVVHCGDVGGTTVLDHLVGRRCGFVWGNMDARDGPLHSYPETVGLQTPAQPPLRLELDGKVLAVFHGHERDMDRAVAEYEPDYILHGHTHTACDQCVGRMRIINPGALHRARPKTVATLDTTTDTVVFYAANQKDDTFAPWTPSR